ncbi:MAG: hypothetical protein ACFFG0_36820 [Candidatus Thorarchaeota archaeon]
MEELLKLVSFAANGIDAIEKGAVGYNGYGFVFRDLSSSLVPFIRSGGSKFCTFSFHREIGKKWDNESLKEELKYDIFLTGCLKTLVPSLKFGGDEILFNCWIFVKTPEKKIFPGTFYYGQSGLSLGGWGANDNYTYKKEFPEKFNEIINFNPFCLTKKELDLLVEALEEALKKVPVSDFYGVYRHDSGQTLMGVRYGEPIYRELYKIDGLKPTEEEIRKLFYSFF